MAIAVSKLLSEKRIKKALIIDFDLHYGDGTANTFSGEPGVLYYHVKGNSSQVFVENLKTYLLGAKAELVAVSAGFDRHRNDWGGLLATSDYKEMGEILGSFARDNCEGRIFAALEGGYNPRPGRCSAGISPGLKARVMRGRFSCFSAKMIRLKNMKTLVIAEKPSVSKDIARALVLPEEKRVY